MRNPRRRRVPPPEHYFTDKEAASIGRRCRAAEEKRGATPYRFNQMPHQLTDAEFAQRQQRRKKTPPAS